MSEGRSDVCRCGHDAVDHACDGDGPMTCWMCLPVSEHSFALTRWPSGTVDLLRDVMVAWGGWLGELSAIEHRQARADYALDLADFERRVRQDERERALR